MMKPRSPSINASSSSPNSPTNNPTGPNGRSNNLLLPGIVIGLLVGYCLFGHQNFMALVPGAVTSPARSIQISSSSSSSSSNATMTVLMANEEETKGQKWVKKVLQKYGVHALYDQPLPNTTTTTTKTTMRFSQKQLEYYLDSFHEKTGGWLFKEEFYMIAMLTAIQHKQFGLVGPIGEIGVHHGKLTTALAMLANPQEKIYAADLFDNQAENTDRSGKGDYSIFQSNMEEFGLSTDAKHDNDMVFVHSVNSLKLDHTLLKQKHFSPFRMFSVDGGHTHNLTLNDLAFAASIIMDGGIILLDDWFRKDWIGVTSALFLFIHNQDRIQPFYIGFNKIFLTTSSHAEIYAEAIRNFDKTICQESNFYGLPSSGSFPIMVPCHLDCDSDFKKAKQKHSPCSKMRDTNQIIQMINSIGGTLSPPQKQQQQNEEQAAS